LHSELLLAELILTETVHGVGLSNVPLKLMGNTSLAWYTTRRLKWIQDSVGWTHTGGLRPDQVDALQNRIRALLGTCGPYHEHVLWRWGGAGALEFGATTWRSNLTRIELVASFLEATRSTPLRIPAEDLDAQTLVSLALLMVAREKGLAVSAGCCADSAARLLGLGVDVRRADGAIYLFSAVDLVVQDLECLRQPPLSMPGLAGMEVALRETLRAARGASRQESAYVGLEELYQEVRTEAVDRGLLVSTPLADEDNLRSLSSIQSWRPPRLPTAGGYDFMTELISLANSQGRPQAPTVSVLLNDSLLAADGTFRDHLAKNPHLALLLLLVYDFGGASERLCLVHEVWQYGDVGLISALDQMLRSFGYQVWDEGYRRRPDRKQWLGRELVNLACRLGLCQVDGARLVERPNDQQFGNDYYGAVNAVSRIRELEIGRE
jgi:hypothetical protein